MKKTLTRRTFLKTSAGAALAAPYIGWKTSASGGAPSGDVRFACFGANGRAWGNIATMSGVPNTTLVAVAEVDTSRLTKLNEEHPGTPVYSDWRELLDKEAKNIDAVIVATPDHMHAPISMSAMQLGKAVYCEKPLSRTVHECRALREYAIQNKIVTQMGNQVSAGSGNRTAVRLLRKGAVGKVKSVHSMNPKSWGAMEPLPTEESPVPETLDWDQWIGVGKMRSYIPREFHPSNWRKRIGYGTGTLGDMGCHIYHPWFMGLKAKAPLSITSHGPGPVDDDSWPINGKIHYVFPGSELTVDGKPFDFTWYDGNQFPGEDVAAAVGGAENIPKSGSVVIGTEGALVIPHGGRPALIYRDGVLSDEEIKTAPSGDHHGDFANAIRGEIKRPLSHFGYSGWMTEAVLLGTVAARLPGETLKWNARKLAFANSEKATAMVSETYRAGWEVEGL